MQNLATLPRNLSQATASDRGVAATRASKRAVRTGSASDHVIAVAMCQCAASAYRTAGSWSHEQAYLIMSDRHAAVISALNAVRS